MFSLQIFSTRILGKRSNIKLKSITILHSQTTETVRLPEGDGGGQVTVHPAIRSKLPLKRKVRNGKLQRKRKGKQSINNNVNSPNKSKSGSPKKKKRVSAAVGAEESHKKTVGETAAVIEIPPSKVKKPPQVMPKSQVPPGKKTKKKKKEVIDYSAAQTDNEGKKSHVTPEIIHKPITPETDPVGKVQNWLLKSQGVGFPKSKSTPERLTEKNRSPNKRPTIRPRNEKSKSVGNIVGEKEKVRLQVVYKPPFKFSVKLKKPDKLSTVVVERGIKKAEKKNNPRTGVLVRTVREKKSSGSGNRVKPESNAVNLKKSENIVQVQQLPDEIDFNAHTVQSDLEVLLSENEFLSNDE